MATHSTPLLYSPSSNRTHVLVPPHDLMCRHHQTTPHLLERVDHLERKQHSKTANTTATTWYLLICVPSFLLQTVIG